MGKALKYCFQKVNNTHKLYIYDDVTAYGSFNWSTWSYDESETSAKYFRDQLEAISDTDTIELHINSNGGSVKEGVAIYNQLKQKGCHKVGYVDGVAYSIAFVILQACDERIMGVGTSALIHDMWVEVAGNARELRTAADDLDVLMQSNRQIFMQRSNLDEQQLIEMMEKETFLTPDECLEYGLIDEIGEYQADNSKQTENLEQQVEQMKNLLAQQSAFKEQLEKMHQNIKQKEPAKEPQQANSIMRLFANM